MDTLTYSKDNRANCTLESKVSDKTKAEACWMGIDEAGRGPVLGPMVYGTCFSCIAEKDKLVEMGFADSKTLTEEKREELMEKILQADDSMGWIVEILSPAFISNAMLRRHKYNLNALSHDTAIGLIQKVLDSGVNLKEVYVDTVGPPEKYQAKLKELFPALDITVAKKADSTYPIVSAASICAKVARDRTVKEWQFKEDIALVEPDYGSGYPGDPKTKKFLVDTLDTVFGFPQFVRFSWSTAYTMLDDKAVEVLWEDNEEEENTPKDVPAITSFFKSNNTSKSYKKNSFFTERSLQPVSDFN